MMWHCHPGKRPPCAEIKRRRRHARAQRRAPCRDGGNARPATAPLHRPGPLTGALRTAQRCGAAADATPPPQRFVSAQPCRPIRRTRAHNVKRRQPRGARCRQSRRRGRGGGCAGPVSGRHRIRQRPAASAGPSLHSAPARDCRRPLAPATVPLADGRRQPSAHELQCSGRLPCAGLTADSSPDAGTAAGAPSALR